MKLRCSRCGVPLNDMFFSVESRVRIVKINDMGVLENVDNTFESTKEHLCSNCFNKYADAMDVLNKEYEGKYPFNMVETVDYVQYS